MKHFEIILLFLLLCVSCVKESKMSVDGPESLPLTVFRAVVDEDSKTALLDGKSVVWVPEEEISILSGDVNTKFVSTNTDTVYQAEFSGRMLRTQNTVYALYPYSFDAVCQNDTLSFQFPKTQLACAGGFSKGQFPTVAKSNTDELYFKNLCGGIKLSVTRNDIEKIVFESLDESVSLSGTMTAVLDETGVPVNSWVEGRGNKLTLNAPNSVFIPGKNYYLVIPPVALNAGYAITYYTSEKYGRYESTVPVSVTRGKFVRRLDLDKNLEFVDLPYIDLSKNGTANCYLVSEPGLYCFNASVKGGSKEELDGTPASAEVLWESFGTDVTPSVGDIVNSATLDDGYVMFSTPDALNNGNAVVAVKDDSGTILWSWHIWVCDGYDPIETAQVYYNNAGTMMDRNLGATSATPGDVHALGLMYQWGRKDPFLGSSSIKSNIIASSTLSWPSAVSSTSITGTIAYTVAHPTTFITYNSYNDDWYYTGSSSTDDTRWQTSDKEKVIYDPCPAGWRLPDSGSNGIWAMAHGSSSSYSKSFDSNNYGYDFSGDFGAAKSIWYPITYYLYPYDGELYNSNEGLFWGTTPDGRYGTCLLINKNGEVYPSSSSRWRADGNAVRCMRMYTGGSGDLEDIEDDDWGAFDLSAEGTANSYIVANPGSYCIKGTVKGNSTESVGTPESAEVLWESFGTDVTPNVGDVVNSAKLRSDGYVTFSIPEPMNNGNAVIAVKDASGNILWSWHIWVCKDFDPKSSAQVYNNNAGTLMDRNLGATSATPGDVHALGLMYQWGRKDPFLSGKSIVSTTTAASTLSWPSAENASAHLMNNNTLAYSVSHPTTYIKNGSSPHDWYCTNSSYQDDNLWSSEKTMYDPCPAGWRVPDGGRSGVWSKAFGSPSSYSSGPWDGTNYGMNFGSGNGKSSSMQLGTASTIWYPAAGYCSYSAGSLASVGIDGYYWSCTPFDYNAYNLRFTYDGYVYPFNNYYRALGRSVRCMVDEQSFEDLSAKGTANCYIVNGAGDYKFNASVKGNSSESVGTPVFAEVLWESLGTDEVPSVGDIVRNVKLQDGYVHFSTPETMNNGNAVIAVKSASAKILWSWHIWACKGFDPEATAQVYKNDAGTLMDRNLGAVSATRGSAGSGGLLYQWGRKDPFLGSNGRDVLAVSTISWPASVASDANCGTIDYASVHPTTFITENSDNKDWYYTGSSSTDDTRWKTPDLEKGMYDPCPAGWRVPDGGNTGTWSKAFGSSYNISSGPWDDTNKGMDFGSGNGKESSMQLGSSNEIWYPAPGYRRGDDVTSMCEYGYYWSSTTTDSSAYRIGVTYKGLVNPSNYSNRSYAQSVRCKKQ